MNQSLSLHKWHFCLKCQRGWKCITIQNYGACDMPMIETCYECKKQDEFKQESFIVEKMMIPHILEIFGKQ